MRKSYWKICVPGPDGEERCTRLYADLRPHGEAPDEAEIGVLASIEQLALQTPDPALRVRLVEALDDAVVRLNTRLPEGVVLRMADDENDAAVDTFDGVPGVVDLPYVEGIPILRNAGYRTRLVWEWHSNAELDAISAQEPKGGAAFDPPTLVTVWVRTDPPEPPVDTDPPFLTE
jgi:hypothetical protein